MGLTTSQVAQAVQAAVQGRVATNLTIDGQEYGVRVSVARDGMGRDDFLSAADVEVVCPFPQAAESTSPWVRWLASCSKTALPRSNASIASGR